MVKATNEKADKILAVIREREGQLDEYYCY